MILVSDVLSIYMIIALDIVITMRFSINYPIVICLPTVCFLFEREVSSENYAIASIFIIYKKHKNTLLQFYFFYIVYNLSYYLPLRDFILVNNHQGD